MMLYGMRKIDFVHCYISIQLTPFTIDHRDHTTISSTSVLRARNHLTCCTIMIMTDQCTSLLRASATGSAVLLLLLLLLLLAFTPAPASAKMCLASSK